MRRLLVLASVVLAWSASQRAQDTAVGDYTVRSAESRVQIHVGTAGVFGFLGHEHLVEAREFEGRLRWNPAAPEDFELRLTFDAAALIVRDPDLDDRKRAQIQSEMETRVLDVEDYPRIVFNATRFRPAAKAAGDDSIDGTVEGTLELHGVTLGLDPVPVRIEVGQGRLRGRGEVTIKGSRFGIERVSAGAGTVKTKDALLITFDLVADSTGHDEGEREPG